MDVISCKIKMRMHFYEWIRFSLTRIPYMLRIEIASEIRGEKKKSGQWETTEIDSIVIGFSWGDSCEWYYIVLWLEKHEYENYNLCVSVNVNRAKNHWVVHYSHANLLSCNDLIRAEWNQTEIKSTRIELNGIEVNRTQHKVTLHPKFMSTLQCDAHTHILFDTLEMLDNLELWWFRFGKWIIANSISLDRNILIMRRLPMAMAMAMQHTLQNWK